MKNIQRDSKYIIKRIIIGVGIAIVLFNAKKCNVYAQDINTNLYFARGSYGSGNGADLVYSTNFTNSFYFNSLRRNLYYTSTDLTLSYLDFNILFNGEIPQNGTQKYLYITFYDSTNNIYRVILFRRSAQVYNDITSSTSSYRVNIREKKGNESYCYSGYCLFLEDSSGQNANQDGDSALFIQDIFLAPNSSVLSNLDATYYSLVYTTQDAVNSVYTSYNTNTYGLTNSSITNNDTTPFNFLNYNWSIVDTNITNLYYDDEEYIPKQDPLSNYIEVDITGKEAILIVPKSYLQLSNTDYYYNEDTNEHFIDLKYGYERCIRSTLVDITNVSEFFTVDSWLQGFTDNPYDTAELCASEPTLTYSRYLYNSPEMEAMGHPYGYMALLLYNNSIDYSSTGSNWINNQHNPYGANSVWVNTELYNYYLIDNLKNFNQTINYKDSSGDDQSTYIETLPTFEEQIESSLNQWNDNSSSLNTSRIESLITFLKIPFTFIRSFNSDSCQPIILPLPKYGNISVPCVKSLISEKLGNNFLTILQVVINGVLIYRITILNIECVRQMLDPVDDKLEVLEL